MMSVGMDWGDGDSVTVLSSRTGAASDVYIVISTPETGGDLWGRWQDEWREDVRRAAARMTEFLKIQPMEFETQPAAWERWFDCFRTHAAPRALAAQHCPRCAGAQRLPRSPCELRRQKRRRFVQSLRAAA